MEALRTDQINMYYKNQSEYTHHIKYMLLVQHTQSTQVNNLKPPQAEVTPTLPKEGKPQIQTSYEK